MQFTSAIDKCSIDDLVAVLPLRQRAFQVPCDQDPIKVLLFFEIPCLHPFSDFPQGNRAHVWLSHLLWQYLLGDIHQLNDNLKQLPIDRQ